MNNSSSELQAALAGIRRDPSLPEPWEQAGYCLVSHKKWEEARQLLALAVEAFPERAVLRARYALALAKTGQLEAAYREATTALRAKPELAEALLARFEILCDAGYYDLALLDSRRLADKNMPETAAFCEGSLCFLTGDRTRGMKLLASVLQPGWRGRDLPAWNGEPTARHVVLYNGQAYGDLIQFIRYVERARKNAAKVTLLAPRAMERLMRDSFPDLALVTDAAELPDDVTLRCSLPSLAAHEDFDPWAHKVPYLRVNLDLAAAWRERLAPVPRPHIGLVWTTPWQMNNPFRTVDFAMLKPLVDAAAPHLVALQMGAEARQAAESGIFDAAPFIADFADSAALMSELDLVITLDSAPAHLAGALGRPAWVFLPFNAEWRWLIGREDSIWYPSLRLFHQREPQGWSDVFETMASGLRSFLSGDARSLRPAPWNGVALNRHPHAVPLPGLDAEAMMKGSQ